MKTILVTGASGYIGSVAVQLLLKNNYSVIAVDNFSTGYREPLDLLKNNNLRVYEADLTKNIDDVFQKEKNIDAVIHYAAFCSVDESTKYPEKYFSNNVVGSQNLLAAVLKYGIKNFIFSSTCAVYGDAQYMPIDENHPIHPTSPYGASKRMVEELIEWYGKLKGLNYLLLRYFNVTGASDDGTIGDSKKPSPHLVQNIVRGAFGIEPFLLTYPDVDTPDKSPIRDYINVVDLNEAHIKGLEYLFSGGKSSVINLGTGSGNSVLEMVQTVKKITGKDVPLKKGVIRTADDPKKIASIEKAKKILDWQPKRSLEDSIHSLVTWYTSYPKGWTT